jgi:hypothetical protein
MKELAVWPKALGKDKHGNQIVAHTPRDEDWLKDKVVKTAIAAAEPHNPLVPATKTKAKAA